MANVCPPLRAVGPSASRWPGIPGSAGAEAPCLPRGCELCGSIGGGIFRRANGAVLCATCDHNANLINPLGGQGVVLEDARKNASVALGCSDQVKVEFVSTAVADGLRCCGALSGASVASEGSMLKCTPNDHLLDALNDPAVLELFPTSMDGAMEGFQSAELDSNWIETLEREGHGLCVPPTPMDERVEVQYDGQMPAGERPGPSVAVLNAAQLQQQQQQQQQQLQQELQQQQLQHQQSLPCFNGAYGAGPLPATPQCPMPVMLFLPMGPWDGMAAAGFKPFAPPPIAPLQSSQNLVDRRARVARYREKRKHRSFENKIRYTSRKLYAENRPRIKGRFARPDELEAYLKEKELVEARQRCDEEEEDEGGDEDMQLLPEC